MLLSEDALRRGQTLRGDVMLGTVADGRGLVRRRVSVKRPHVIEDLRLLIEGLEIYRVEVVVCWCAPARRPTSAGFVIELAALSVFAPLIRKLLSLTSVRSFLAWLRAQSPFEGLMALSAVGLLVGHHVRVKDVEILRLGIRVGHIGQVVSVVDSAPFHEFLRFL